MQVKITQQSGIHFEVTTSRGVKFDLKPKEHISPLEYFAIGLISCSGTDIVMLPEKQGKTVKNLEVTGDLERTDQAPYRFTDIHLTYRFDSDGSDLDARRWVLSSLESYCTTVNTVRGVAKVFYTIIHNGVCIADHENIVSGETGSMGLTADAMGGDACPS